MKKVCADRVSDTAAEYMTREEVAEYLSISVRSVDRLIRKNGFNGMQRIGRLVRIHKPTLDRYLAIRRK